jgi:hypothetical protein
MTPDRREWLFRLTVKTALTVAAVAVITAQPRWGRIPRA